MNYQKQTQAHNIEKITTHSLSFHTHTHRVTEMPHMALGGRHVSQTKTKDFLGQKHRLT